MALKLEKILTWVAYILLAYVLITFIFHIHHAVMMHKIHHHVKRASYYGDGGSARFFDPKFPMHLVNNDQKNWQTKVGYKQEALDIKERENAMTHGASAF